MTKLSRQWKNSMSNWRKQHNLRHIVQRHLRHRTSLLLNEVVQIFVPIQSFCAALYSRAQGSVTDLRWDGVPGRSLKCSICCQVPGVASQCFQGLGPDQTGPDECSSATTPYRQSSVGARVESVRRVEDRARQEAKSWYWCDNQTRAIIRGVAWQLLFQFYDEQQQWSKISNTYRYQPRQDRLSLSHQQAAAPTTTSDADPINRLLWSVKLERALDSSTARDCRRKAAVITSYLFIGIGNQTHLVRASSTFKQQSDINLCGSSQLLPAECQSE